MGVAGVDIREIWDAAELALLHSTLVCTRPSQPLAAGCGQGNELEKKGSPAMELFHQATCPGWPQRAPITQSTHPQWM